MLRVDSYSEKMGESTNSIVGNQSARNKKTQHVRNIKY